MVRDDPIRRIAMKIIIPAGSGQVGTILARGPSMPTRMQLSAAYSAPHPIRSPVHFLAHTQFEKVGRFDNGGIVYPEHAQRSDAKQRLGTVEECHVDPKRFVGRPPR